MKLGLCVIAGFECQKKPEAYEKATHAFIHSSAHIQNIYMRYETFVLRVSAHVGARKSVAST